MSSTINVVPAAVTSFGRVWVNSRSTPTAASDSTSVTHEHDCGRCSVTNGWTGERVELRRPRQAGAERKIGGELVRRSRIEGCRSEQTGDAFDEVRGERQQHAGAEQHGDEDAEAVGGTFEPPEVPARRIAVRRPQRAQRVDVVATGAFERLHPFFDAVQLTEEHHRHQHDQRGDHHERRDDRTVPLPTGEVDDDVDARHREDDRGERETDRTGDPTGGHGVATD